MNTIPRAVAAAAIDCPRCRELVAKYADADVRVLAGEETIDAGTGVAYAATRHYGRTTSSHDEHCPDCGRTVSITENRNTYASVLRVDRKIRLT